MDSPTSSGIQIHDAGDFGIMGRMATLPNYQSGDWVRYGGMVYKPTEFSGQMAYTPGDYASGGGSCWPKGKIHLANIYKWAGGWTFHCS